MGNGTKRLLLCLLLLSALVGLGIFLVLDDRDEAHPPEPDVAQAPEPGPALRSGTSGPEPLPEAAGPQPPAGRREAARSRGRELQGTVAEDAPADDQEAQAEFIKQMRRGCVRLYKDSKLEEAKACFYTVLWMEPDNSINYRNYGSTCARLGQVGEQYWAYEKYLELTTDEHLSEQVRKMLDDYDERQLQEGEGHR